MLNINKIIGFGLEGFFVNKKFTLKIKKRINNGFYFNQLFSKIFVSTLGGVFEGTAQTEDVNRHLRTFELA